MPQIDGSIERKWCGVLNGSSHMGGGGKWERSYPCSAQKSPFVISSLVVGLILNNTLDIMHVLPFTWVWGMISLYSRSPHFPRHVTHSHPQLPNAQQSSVITRVPPPPPPITLTLVCILIPFLDFYFLRLVLKVTTSHQFFWAVILGCGNKKVGDISCAKKQFLSGRPIWFTLMGF